ncbi:acetate--CoA ligase [bacterium]|nr:acetate--CoA ligase [bacterium]
MRITSKPDYISKYSLSISDPDKYWGDVASSFTWDKEWSQVRSGTFSEQNIEWFPGSKLNITNNCLDRHLETKGDETALIWVSNDPTKKEIRYSYKELHREVSRFANVLKNLGTQKGDRVCFYMGMVPELLFGVLASARIGAVHSVVFGGFSSASLAGRINDCEAKILVTNDGSNRGEKIIHLKDIADEALKQCTSIEATLIVESTELSISYGENQHNYGVEVKKVEDYCDYEIMDAEDPLFILYTSGSTGKPKGLIHTTAGYMVYASHTFDNVFQAKDKDVFWCTADIGWITGHSYITYGPLLNGSTTVMFEGVPTWPDAGRFWGIVEDLKVTHFYTAPTAIRALEVCGDEHVKKHDLSSLKVLGSVGEPINEEAWHWYNEVVGNKNCPIVDTWWQTETGGIMISSVAGITDSVPAHATIPLPGVEPVLMDADGKEILSLEGEGRLCIRNPWPGMARTIYGDASRFKDTYFSAYPGLYFTGDGAKRNTSGNYRITGRVDDVIIVSGHNIGTAEVEDALDEHQNVVESAVVGFPHDIKGQAIKAYVIVKDEVSDHESFRDELIEVVAKHVGPLAKPEVIQVVAGLPKTRSGKIMRRILRKIAAGEKDGFGDISTLLNPEIVESISNESGN